MTIVVGKDEVLYVNRVCADVMGYSKEEFYERDFDFKALVASEQREKVAANIMKRLKGGDPPPEDFRLLAKGGREIIVIPSTKVVEFAGQKAVLGILTDVTRRRASEERLRESEARYQGLFESSPVGLIEADLSMVKAAIDELTRQGVDDFGEYFRNNPERLANVFLNMKPLGVNNAFLELYGMQSVAELSEYLARSRFAGWQETLENLCIAMARGEKEAQGKGVSETSRGEELNLRMQGTVVRGHEKDYSRVLVALVDMTAETRAAKKLEEAQERLIQTSKMAALGTLAAGVAHEINQPLTGIKSFAQVALRDLGKNDVSAEYFERILGQTEGIARIIEGVGSFSRPSDASIEPVDINQGVQACLTLVRDEASQDSIEIVEQLGRGLPKIEADMNQLSQVCLNLFSNAIQSMKKNKNGAARTMTVETFARKHGNEVCLKVTDTGRGIPEKDRPQIFDPFFTTKGRDGGIGLGLSIAHGIVQNHGGTIEVDSEQGRGATFKVCLPVAKKR